MPSRSPVQRKRGRGVDKGPQGRYGNTVRERREGAVSPTHYSRQGPVLRRGRPFFCCSCLFVNAEAQYGLEVVMPNPIYVPYAVGTKFIGKLFINMKVGEGEGWCETYDLKGASYVEALSSLDAIWLARRATLAQDCYFRYGYVSDKKLKGDSLIYSPGSSMVGGSYGDIHVFSQQGWNVLRLRLESGPLYHTFRSLRGVPTDQSTNTIFATGDYLAAVNLFGDALKANANNFCKQKPDDPAPTGNFKGINSVTALTFGEHRVGRPFGLQRGQRRKKKVVEPVPA
jgi:hypothetical protein